MNLTDSGGTAEIAGGSGWLWFGGSAAAPIIFRNNGYLTRMWIDPNGNVGIGTLSPQYPLSVNGTIEAKQVMVQTNWSDYVFDAGYRLAGLQETAAYIQQNHHLPGLPAAAEVEQNGVNLGDMEAKLLAKIEELTLHMIHADERNTRLEEENRELREGRATGKRAVAYEPANRWDPPFRRAVFWSVPGDGDCVGAARAVAAGQPESAGE